MTVTKWSVEAFLREGYGRRYLWIDLVNSEYADGLGAVTDYLSSESWRRSLFAAWALPPNPRTAFPLGAFQSLRGQLRSAGEQLAREAAVSPATLERINEALGVQARLSIERTGRAYRVIMRPARFDWQWLRAQIAASFGDFLTSGRPHRLKICANPRCRWMFYDETRSNTKRWCDDRLCGNRDKVRRYRAKQRPHGTTSQDRA